jgi:hypothetical protein
MNRKTATGRSLFPTLHAQSRYHQQHTSSPRSKRSRNQQRIDQQIWLLHQAMAEKILQQPTLTAQVRQKLDLLQQQKQIRHGAYLYWSCLLDLVDEPEKFRTDLLSFDEQPCKYRRRTPMTGLLSEEERQLALMMPSGHPTKTTD